MLTRNPSLSGLYDTLVQTVANPAAGADATATPPANQRSMLVGVNLELATDANVVDRYLRIRRQRGAQPQWLGLDKYPQPNSTQHFYLAGVGLGQSYHAATPVHNISLLPTPAFEDGDTLIIEFVGMQVADQISNIFLTWHIQVDPR